MKTKTSLLAVAVAATAFSALLAQSGSAAMRYVDLSSIDPSPPFTTWATAATTIQDAVDAAVAGDEIVVTNGVYQTGGRAVFGTMTNRVAVDKPLRVRSANGPGFTVIRGFQVPGTTNGDGAVRCVYLANGTSLAGFTLTNGATRTHGDPSLEQSGGGVWGEPAGAVVSNCVMAGNAAYYGGGVRGATLHNCAFTGNSAYYGGGDYDSTLHHCTLTGNSARDAGGGAYESKLNNCTLTGNAAGIEGGGASWGMLNNCTLTGNSALNGGGASGATLSNCLLNGNKAVFEIGAGNYDGTGGGAIGGTLNNCTLSGNSAGAYGGGAYVSTLNNCIVYNNHVRSSEANYYLSQLNYCCTTPMPGSGVGNITAEPQLADAAHLSAGSPCRAAGGAAFIGGVDTDGELWANPPSIGCDEFYAGVTTGPLGVTIAADYTNVATGFTVNLNAMLMGRASGNRWEFGDGTIASNWPVAVPHSWSTPGDFTVVFRAYNDGHPGGVSATVTVRVLPQPVHYVAAASGSPVAPFSSWATAARNIQDAVDAGTLPGALILVTNGVYQTGGRALHGTMTNRVSVTKPLTVRSVNGPELTVIRGYQVPSTRNGDGAVRCVYLTDGAALAGFTLTNGATRTKDHGFLQNGGGGVWCESASALVSNCTLGGNWASDAAGGAHGGTLSNCTLIRNSALWAGGASSSTLNNCTLTGNYAPNGGGGAYGGTLNNCTLSGNNSASQGGGVQSATLNNCTLSSNSADQGGGAYGGTLNNCTLTGNVAYTDGGGAFNSTLNNCALTGNSAKYGGGAFAGTLYNCTITGNSARDFGGGAYQNALFNCIVYYNTAGFGEDNYGDSLALNYCCTTPSAPFGMGNFTNAPLFADPAGGNLHLQSNSPCITSGLNTYAPTSSDLDGDPRIVGGTVDVGAYEFQSPQSAISYAWLQGYGLPTDGSVDFTDADGDGLNNWQEWRCLTDPINALSALRLLAPASMGIWMRVRWQSVSGRNYFLERSTNLGAQPPFETLATDIFGQAGTTTFLDTDAAGAGPFFYRVGVRP